ncbi:MAG: aminomethyl-transferring glycine dehydrogenase subunit GcvPA [Alphaproteobacteria bacterium]|nr:aminomethyl-transferring glycine dehydrogenase subunit GcvPA [Alphaproteobacteria bacterium]
MIYTPHTDEERRQMLDAIGVGTLEGLFDDVPERVRFPHLDLPAPLSEMALSTELRRLAARNVNLEDTPCFLGAGAYRHFIPATVDYVLQRGEFYTAYTPYQPEMSQGMLQAMFEYQTMICRLTGMEVSNASHYDGATSLAEAVLLAIDAAKGGRRRIVMSPSVHPHHRGVVETYLQGTDATLHGPDDPAVSAADLIPLVDTETAALVVQTPNVLGRLEDLDGLADVVHEHGALLIVAVDPISLGLFKPPGAFGADVVVADGQPLGIAPSFGGPSLGIFATRRAYIRRLVGRLVGETVDTEGRRGYVLTLATREQHIRRARATSNICTNAALGALAAATYLATVGKQGFRRIAELCWHKSHYAAARISNVAGLTVNSDAPNAPFFKEFVVDLPRPVREVNAILREEHGLIGGYDLGRFFVGQENRMLIAVTEMNTRAEIDHLAGALGRLVS